MQGRRNGVGERRSPFIPTGCITSTRRFVASLPSAVMVEYFPDLSVLNIGEVLLDPIEAKDGTLAVSQEPGTGVAFDERAVDRFAVDSWK